jgi:hypothetical protein
MVGSQVGLWRFADRSRNLDRKYGVRKCIYEDIYEIDGINTQINISEGTY